MWKRLSNWLRKNTLRPIGADGWAAEPADTGGVVVSLSIDSVASPVLGSHRSNVDHRRALQWSPRIVTDLSQVRQRHIGNSFESAPSLGLESDAIGPEDVGDDPRIIRIVDRLLGLSEGEHAIIELCELVPSRAKVDPIIDEKFLPVGIEKPAIDLRVLRLDRRRNLLILDGKRRKPVAIVDFTRSEERQPVCDEKPMQDGREIMLGETGSRERLDLRDIANPALDAREKTRDLLVFQESTSRRHEADGNRLNPAGLPRQGLHPSVSQPPLGGKPVPVTPDANRLKNSKRIDITRDENERVHARPQIPESSGQNLRRLRPEDAAIPIDVGDGVFGEIEKRAGNVALMLELRAEQLPGGALLDGEKHRVNRHGADDEDAVGLFPELELKVLVERLPLGSGRPDREEDKG